MHAFSHMMQHKASRLKNILLGLTVSLQINTQVCGGASVNVHVKGEKTNKRTNKPKTAVSARPEMEIDGSIKSVDVLHCAFWEVAVIKVDFKYSLNLLYKSQLVPDHWAEGKQLICLSDRYKGIIRDTDDEGTRFIAAKTFE